MATRIGNGRRNGDWYYEVIDSFYNSKPQPAILHEPISTVVAAATTIDENH